MEDYKKQFHIRYMILKFTVRMLKNAVLPVEKASAIRGGFGNCLLDIYCINSIKPEPCRECTFRQACIVQNIMYAPLKVPVSSVHDKESEGYSISCTDRRTEFFEGDTFVFSITLFGDVIVYLQPILQAFFQLGIYGIGKERSRFEIVEIKNQFGQSLFENGNVCLKHYQFQYVEDYILHRIKKLKEESSTGNKNRREKEQESAEWKIRLKVCTPLSLKYHGILLRQFHIGGFMNALSRRVYIMNCFEGQEKAFQRIWKDGTSWESFHRKEAGELSLDKEKEYLPEVRVKWDMDRSVRRYSFAQKRKMSMDGIAGEFLLYGVTSEMLWYLLAGEILHVGKYTSFGFGKYYIDLIDRDCQ